MIRLQNVGYSYANERQVLKNVSATFERGKIICILGPSGCGKTTLLRILAGMTTEFDGVYEIDGLSSKEYFKKTRIGFVAQKYANFEWLTVEQNISLACSHKDPETRNVLLKDLGLQHVKNYFVSQLSGGMQQRVAIGRCIAQNADIIALDEPFGALDPETKILMQDFLLRQIAKTTATVIMVTHDIEEALYVADTICVVGGQPGTIVHTYEVPFSRPRQYEQRFSRKFEKSKKILYSMMYSETMKSILHKNETHFDTDSVRIGLPIWAGSMPFFLAQVSGVLRKGKSSFYLESFADHQKKLQDFLVGKHDVCHMTLDVYLGLSKERNDLELLFPAAQSRGADAILVKEGIVSVSDVKEKRVGAVRNDLSIFFLSYVLRKHGLSEADVQIQEGPIDELAHAFMNDTIDAVMLWEPWLSKIKHLSGVHTLVSTLDFPVLFDVVVCKKEFAQIHKEEVALLKHAWDTSMQYYREFPEEAIELVSSTMGLSAQDLMRQLQGVAFYTSDEHIPSDLFHEVQSY